MSTLARPATGFTSMPEPRTIGSVARGRQLLAGNFPFAGHLITDRDASIWEIYPPDDVFVDELQGFAWLDDLASVGDLEARARAQAWVWEWIARFGRGTGPGWRPELTGRRLIRWINHALFLLRGREKADSDKFYRSLGQQTIFLGRRWHTAAPGLPRFEALTGLIYAGMALQGMERHVRPASLALARECSRQVNTEGGIPTRNPEELLEVFTLLTWAAAALSEANHRIETAHVEAIERIAPSLRTLRHADGGLARFHGGGRGMEGRLDHALAASHTKGRAPDGLSMGFSRLSSGRTSVIVDAALPPSGTASTNAHASTLAFELTSGRRPVIVNCGSGASFGEDWRRAGRSTMSHSTMVVDEMSSARLAKTRGSGGWREEQLVDGPTEVLVEIARAEGQPQFQGAHDGYVRDYGLTHARTLELSYDGRELRGEDMLVALDEAARRRFEKALDAKVLVGIPYDLRFHLHPEADANVDLGGSTVSIALRSGEVWLFRHNGVADMFIDNSVYLERGRLQPRTTRQIVLSGVAMKDVTCIRWSLAKAQDTAVAIRDLARDDPDPEF